MDHRLDHAIDGALDSLRAEVDRVDKFVQVAWHGLDFARGATQIHDALYGPGALVPKRAKPPREHYAKLEQYGKNEESSGFTIVYELAIVRLWSLVEGAADKIAQALIEFDPDVWARDALSSLKVPIAEVLGCESNERAYRLLVLLRESLRGKLKTGIGRFEVLMHAVGLDGGVPEPARKAFVEFGEVRNVLVHAGGKADLHFTNRCPWIPVRVGDPVVSGNKQLYLFLHCSTWYGLELWRRARAKGFTRPKEGEAAESKVVALCEHLVDQIQKIDDSRLSPPRPVQDTNSAGKSPDPSIKTQCEA